jgi:hypothetical protein
MVLLKQNFVVISQQVQHTKVKFVGTNIKNKDNVIRTYIRPFGKE